MYGKHKSCKGENGLYYIFAVASAQDQAVCGAHFCLLILQPL